MGVEFGIELVGLGPEGAEPLAQGTGATRGIRPQGGIAQPRRTVERGRVGPVTDEGRLAVR